MVSAGRSQNGFLKSLSEDDFEAIRPHLTTVELSQELPLIKPGLAAAGVLERYPGLMILLAHGGGGLPALRGRLQRAHTVRPEARSGAAAGPAESLRRFWFDSLTHDRGVLAGLVAWAGADRVLLGSDRPFDMGTDRPVDDIRALRLGAGEELVLGGNACRLLGLPCA